MQVISGQAGGIKLHVPKGIEIRPTGARAKSALFNSLGDFSEMTVVDLFSGTGALGLEAASRGAKKVLMVEFKKAHCEIIKKNIDKVKNAGITCECIVVNGNALSFFKWEKFKNLSGNFDFVFSDPPYSISASCFKRLGNDQKFIDFIKNATLVWEIPDNLNDKSIFFDSGLYHVKNWHKFGKTDFFIAKAGKNE